MTLKAPAIPEGLALISTPLEVIIRRRWFSWVIIPMLIFAIVWDGFLVFWYSAAFFGKHRERIMILYPLV